ncbi:MAG: hypothetical protein ACRC4M_00280 [Mycoplasma sp.]
MKNDNNIYKLNISGWYNSVIRTIIIGNMLITEIIKYQITADQTILFLEPEPEALSANILVMKIFNKHDAYANTATSKTG